METGKTAKEKPRSLLEESALLFAISGGWRMAGVKLDLSRARWLCLAPPEKPTIWESALIEDDSL